MSAAVSLSDELRALVARKGWAKLPSPPLQGIGPITATTNTTSAIDLAVMLGYSRRQRQLDRVTADISRDFVDGNIGDSDYNALINATERRRADVRANTNLHHARYGAPRRYVYNRTASKDRRRGLLRLGVVPDWLANGLTPGEECVAAVILQDIQHRGHCDKTNGEIAQLAGCCTRLVIRTKERLAESGIFEIVKRPRTRQRHDTTIIRAASDELKLWLRDYRPTRASASREATAGISLIAQSRLPGDITGGSEPAACSITATTRVRRPQISRYCGPIWSRRWLSVSGMCEPLPSLLARECFLASGLGLAI